MNTKYYFKFLDNNRQPCHGGSGQWPPPGEWTKTIPNPEPCKSGYHLCRKQDLHEWCHAPTLWIAEADPVGILLESNKVVARSACLVRQVEEWNEKNQRLFAADCAERVLHHFESVYTSDTRPRQAIETARRFTLGQATEAELAAAYSAAESAAWSAYSAAWSSAYSAARSSARSAAVFALFAAESAALSASESESESAIYSAAWSTEHTWQINHLLTHYLKLNPEDFA